LDYLKGIEMTEKAYLSVKKSQVHHYDVTPLYKKNSEGGFILYKSENEKIDINRFTGDRYPQLFIDR